MSHYDYPERPLSPPEPKRRSAPDEDALYDKWRQDQVDAEDWLRRSSEAAKEVIEERK